MSKCRKDTQAEHANAEHWLVSQPDLDGALCYFVRLVVEGHGVHLCGPYEDKAEATEVYEKAMGIFGTILADIHNNEVDLAYRQVLSNAWHVATDLREATAH